MVDWVSVEDYPPYPHGIEWQTTITFKNGFFPFRIENEWKFSILKIMKVT